MIFIQNGQIALCRSVDDIRENEGKSVDEYFRGGLQMLKNLIKYEFKATGRTLGLLYGPDHHRLRQPPYFRAE